jgi:CheY-like chemotaxis protein
MKLLIIAGPYEADRIRKAALSAGFETVAVEPGESLSGWITASRPELIVMAPQIVHADPALALAKVRAVPRGRVPIFLVGDAADEARLRDLADGFFVRPIAPELLLERARAILAPAEEVRRRKISSLDIERTEMGLGPVAERRRKNSSPDLERTEMGLGPTGQLPPVTPNPTGAPAPAPRPTSGGHPARPAGLTLKPLVAAALGGAPIAPARAPNDPSALLAELGAGIDALLDAELDAVLAGAPKAAKVERSAKPVKPANPAKPGSPPVPPDETPMVVPPRDFPGETTKKVEPALLGVMVKSFDAGRARLLARYAPIEKGDYFAVLDVPRDASTADLRRAHEKISRETTADALDPELAHELAAQIEGIRTVTAEALRVLSDENLRKRYASHLSPVAPIAPGASAAPVAPGAPAAK